MNFETLGLRAELAKAAEELGFEAPMPIQEKAIPELLRGDTDFIGLAHTGTGKTGAFGLPLIQMINPSEKQPHGIVICPTRELCLQITGDLKQFAAHLGDVGITAVYGGASIMNQISEIKRTKPNIIVATPGRLIDLVNRKKISLANISYAVLDEADEMLNMGFQEDIDRILETMPEDRNVWLFSATMPAGVAAIARKYLNDPVEITVGGKNKSPDNIAHICYVVHERNRFQGLKRIIDFTPDIFGLVFCRTRSETQTVAEALVRDGYHAEALHGDLSQSQRDHVMRKFRQRSVKILVATDVAARGLDIDDITHVIHYKLPDDMEMYTHRSGRTARAGKSGQSIALINPKEKHRIKTLERKGNIRFALEKIPGGKAICEKRLFSLVDKIVDTDVDNDDFDEYLPAVCDALADLDREELIKRLLAPEFGRYLEHYRNAEDINADSRTKKDGKKSKPAKGKYRPEIRNIQRFFINFGRLDRINEGAIVRLLCDKAGLRSGMIGAISMNREYSFFDVEKSAAGIVGKALKNAKLDGRQVEVHKVHDGGKKKRSGNPRRK